MERYRVGFVRLQQEVKNKWLYTLPPYPSNLIGWAMPFDSILVGLYVPKPSFKASEYKLYVRCSASEELTYFDSLYQPKGLTQVLKTDVCDKVIKEGSQLSVYLDGNVYDPELFADFRSVQ